MKTHLCLCLALAVGGAAVHCQAGPDTPAPAVPSPAADEVAGLERFLSMSDAELDQLQQAIARVRAMSPAERDVLRKRIAEYRRLPAAERQEVRRGWGWVDDRDRDDWPRFMHAQSDVQRQSIQQEMQALPPGQRAAWKHSLLERWRNGSGK